MIKVGLYENKNGDLYGFRVRSHGDAIACAGVSALVITCANFIMSRLGVGKVIKLDPNSGCIDFIVPCIKQGKTNKEAALAMEQMVFGLRQIQESYKNQIRIQTRKSDEHD